MDVTGGVGKLMDLKCSQPKNTDIVRNPWRGSWWEPSWLGSCWGDVNDLMLERAWGIVEAPIMRKSLYLSYFLVLTFPGLMPTPILTVGQEIVDAKSECTSWMLR